MQKIKVSDADRRAKAKSEAERGAGEVHLWQIDVGDDGHISRRYTATAAEARQWQKENFPFPSFVNCREITIRATPAALAVALNSVLREYCVNEH